MTHVVPREPCADGGSASRGWEKVLTPRPGGGGLVGMEGGADLVDLGAVDADGFVKDLGGDAELVGPVGHVGGDLGVDDVGVVRSLGVVFVGGVGFDFLGLLFVLYGIMLGHRGPRVLVRRMCGFEAGMSWAALRVDLRWQGRSEFRDDLGGQGLLGGFVLDLGEVDAVDCDEEEVLAFEDVEGGGVAGAGDEEGVVCEAGDGDEAAAGNHGVAEGFVAVAGVIEREVGAGCALAVGPGAVGGAVAGGAGFAVEEGRGEDGFDLEGREQGARGCGWLGAQGVGGEDGCEDDGRGGEAEETRRAKGHGDGALWGLDAKRVDVGRLLRVGRVASRGGRGALGVREESNSVAAPAASLRPAAARYPTHDAKARHEWGTRRGRTACGDAAFRRGQVFAAAPDRSFCAAFGSAGASLVQLVWLNGEPDAMNERIGRWAAAVGTLGMLVGGGVGAAEAQGLPQTSPAARSACGPSDVDFNVKAAKVPKGTAFATVEAPPAGKALVYVAEDYAALFPLTSTALRAGADGQWVGAFKQGMHMSFVVDPGVHHVCLSSFDLRPDPEEHGIALLRLDAVAGKTYYLRARATGDRAPLLVSLDAVDEDEGQFLVEMTRQAVWKADQ